MDSSKIEAHISDNTVTVSTDSGDNCCKVSLISDHEFYATFKLKNGDEVNVEILNNTLIISTENDPSALAEVCLDEDQYIQIFADKDAEFATHKINI